MFLSQFLYNLILVFKYNINSLLSIFNIFGNGVCCPYFVLFIYSINLLFNLILIVKFLGSSSYLYVPIILSLSSFITSSLLFEILISSNLNMVV